MTRQLSAAVQGKLAQLQPSFAGRLRQLLEDAPTAVTITSGYRSSARQAELYRLFLAGKGNPANRPGTSRHEAVDRAGRPAALAADLALGGSRTWAHAHARRYRLRFPYGHEPWHVEPDGSPDPIPAAAPEQEDDDVARLVTDKAGGQAAPIYGTDGTVRWHAPNPTALEELKATGVYGDGKVWPVSAATIDALPLVERRRTP